MDEISYFEWGNCNIEPLIDSYTLTYIKSSCGNNDDYFDRKKKFKKLKNSESIYHTLLLGKLIIGKI